MEITNKFLTLNKTSYFVFNVAKDLYLHTRRYIYNSKKKKKKKIENKIKIQEIENVNNRRKFECNSAKARKRSSNCRFGTRATYMLAKI